MLTAKLKAPKRLAKASAILFAATLASCASLTSLRDVKPAASVDPNRVACGSFSPITWSPADTDESIAQIKEHNAAWKRLCGARRD